MAAGKVIDAGASADRHGLALPGKNTTFPLDFQL